MAPPGVHEGSGVNVSAVVLAAGRATRMGMQKLLLPLGEKCLVQWVADAALGAKVAETIIVVGHDAGAVRAAVSDRPVKIVMNPAYAQGMSTSLQAAVRALSSYSDAAIFLLGDQPFVTSTLVDRLIDSFVETRGWIVRPEVRGRLGHPVLMSATLFPEILELRGDVGGREIVERHRERRVTIPWDEGRPALDIDTMDDYQAASRCLELRVGSRLERTEGGGDRG
jgi:molybdenum cofactor cytidylyltransferase